MLPRTGTSMRVGRLATALLASTALAGIAPALAGELPSGGSVAFGAVGISTPRPNAMAIKQSSGTAIVNWQSFSIGRDSRVDIAQPSAASTLLNRVGGNTPSTIAGKLNANGQVYLVNPNGIAITKTGVVKAGAFVASTLAISDDDFKAGKRVFKGSGQSAAVTNKGAIEIGRGGYAALIGGKVANAGVVSVPLGKVGLGAGEQATLDLSGDGFLQVAVPSANSAPGALIRQSGRIRADGGRVEIQAATAREAARHAINMSGIVEARSVGGRSGAIVLGGGDGGRVTVSGKLDARGASKLAKGGAITITGNDIRLRSAVLDARGRAGGGTIKIGGDLQGKGDLQRAATTSLDAKTRIRADATRTGDGGEVVVWSDERTTFDGRIAAKGGPQGGDGGKVEVSGKALLEYRGFVNLSARRGDFGTLLLDPYNVFITSGPDARGSLANGVFTPSGPNSVINATTLRTALGAADVTVTTGAAGSPGGQAGDIGVLANVSWSAPTTLTLSAARNITVGSAAGGVISVPSGGDLVLRADNSGTGAGTVAFQGLGRVATAANSTVSILYNPTAVGGGSKYDNAINFAPNVTGSGSLTAFMLVNTVADLQGIDANLGGTYAQGRDIDASSTAAGAGFSPIGLAVASGSAFTGIFDGRNQVIDGLSINRPQLIATGTGLFGTTGPTAVITNVGLTNVSITGGNNVGALVGKQRRHGQQLPCRGTVFGKSVDPGQCHAGGRGRTCGHQHRTDRKVHLRWRYGPRRGDITGNDSDRARRRGCRAELRNRDAGLRSRNGVQQRHRKRRRRPSRRHRRSSPRAASPESIPERSPGPIRKAPSSRERCQEARYWRGAASSARTAATSRRAMRRAPCRWTPSSTRGPSSSAASSAPTPPARP